MKLTFTVPPSNREYWPSTPNILRRCSVYPQAHQVQQLMRDANDIELEINRTKTSIRHIFNSEWMERFAIHLIFSITLISIKLIQPGAVHQLC